MKIAIAVARILLGLTFTVFGLNGFLHFLPMGPVPPTAMQYLTAVSQSHYMSVVFAFQLLCGILLLANQFVPLAVTILAAIIANILLFHITMAPAGLPIALFALLLWIVVFYSVRHHFAGIFTKRSAAV